MNQTRSEKWYLRIYGAIMLTCLATAIAVLVAFIVHAEEPFRPDLTGPEWNLIFRGLQELPYRDTAMLIAKLQAQAQAQQQAAQKAAEDAKKAKEPADEAH